MLLERKESRFDLQKYVREIAETWTELSYQSFFLNVQY